MSEVKLNRLIETFYFKLYKNNNPIDVMEFNMAFAMNEYYNSKMPIARHGISDIFIENNHKHEVSYDSEFVARLAEIDRYMVTDRVAYFSMMRSVMPTFYLINKDDKEIKVESFASMSEDGQCSISYVYTGFDEFNENSHTEILEWSNFKCIKIDMNLQDILDIKDDVDENVRFVGYEIEKLFSTFSEKSKFGLALEVLITILAKHFEKDPSQKNNIIAYNHMQNVYRYYQFETIERDHTSLLNTIRKITQQLPLDYYINEFMCDMGKNITQYADISTYGYENMLIEIRSAEKKHKYESIETFYSIFDYFLMEREKLLNFIVKYKNRKYDVDYDEEELIEDSNYILNKVNSDLIYDFYKEKYFTAKAVYECLNIERYVTELEKIQQKIENTVIRKERFKKEKDSQKLNIRMQLVSVLFSIPVVCDLVEIFYAKDMPKWIVFPKSYAKILWIAITIVVIMFYFEGVKKQRKDNK